MKQILTIYSLLFSILSNGLNSLKCVDENNEAVEWYVAYKMPAIKQGNNLIQHGLSYVYMTSKDDSTWITSKIPINASNSLIGNTISNLYRKGEDIFSILYNDETPSKQSTSEKGHTKGVVLADSEAGLWLIHSVPKFPRQDFYVFPESGTKYGQSFLCISTDLKNLDRIGQQLQYNEPEIYFQNIPNALRTKLPFLTAAAESITVQKPPWFHQIEIQTLNGTSFISFAKSRKFGKDLYADWVAPALQTNLYVETWVDGPGRLHSDCTKKFKVKNVVSIVDSNLNISFTSTHDHSKWAISPSDDQSWICIGDINRAEHQESRGGGTVCLKNKKIRNSYQSLIKNVEECE